MFFRTMNLTKFEDNPSEPLSEIEDGRVLRLLQGGHQLKVVMTQDYYLKLLSQIEDLKIALTIARGGYPKGEEHVPCGKIKPDIRARIKARREKDGYHDDSSLGSGKKENIRVSARIP
ncbi:MAG: hypothetical protein RIR26_386 [Pseudomonadota bacterium]